MLVREGMLDLASLNRDKPEGARVRHDARVPFGPSMAVDRYVLGNGLTVLLLEDHAAPVLSVQTWFAVGSRHERPGKTGISHLFEHLMFGETEAYEHGAFDRILEEQGAETNAATFLDWTYYHANLPKEALGKVLELEAARLSRLALRDDTVASEKEVVANERRMRVDDDVDGAVSELLYQTAFRRHGYGIPTIGFMTDIEGFTTEDCRAFYATYYSPNNATLVVVGDLDPAATLALVQEHYGALARAEIPVEDVSPEPPQTEERRVETRKPTATEKVAIGYRSPALGDFDNPPLVLLCEILFGGRASRMYRSLVREREVASEARGWVGTFRDPALLDVYLTGREGKTCEELLAAHDAIIDAARREAPTQEELDRAKARVELGALQGLETASGKAEQLGFYETVLGDPAALFTRLEAFRRVTRGDLLRVARRYLEPASRTLVLVRPDGSVAGADDDGEEAA